jgi:creatinine amidohydrolase
MSSARQEIEWRKLRADELRARAAANAIVIVPIGSLEQHGPHLPVEVDSMLGETVALETARRMIATIPTLVLPCVWTGISEHHMSFGGTVTLPFATFSALISDICRSLVRHGFRRIVLLNGHGGNEYGLKVVCDELAPELDAAIIQTTYWHGAAEPIAALLERQKMLMHACEAETSMMMAVRGDLIDSGRFAMAESERTPELSEIVGPGLYRWRSLAARAATGVVGFPTAASAEKGRRLIDGIADELARKFSNEAIWSQTWR